MNNWLEAAKKYREARIGPQAAEIAQGTLELEAFMRDEGKIAMELLKESRQFVRLGETESEGGRCTVYILNHDGLQESNEASGSWVAYAKPSELPPPMLSPRNARTVVEMLVRSCGKKGAAIVACIRADLERIAAAAPR